MSTAAVTRLAFVETVATVFDAARIDFALLHNSDGRDQTDSDVDVVVARGSLGAVDTVIRSGALGRLIQRLDYDVPWCRYYIVATDDSERPFRQLDVACDPFGIGRYGLVLEDALLDVRRDGVVPRPSDTASLVYLAAKRAEKAAPSEKDVQQLLAAFETAAGGAAALTHAFGDAGSRLADALASGIAIEEALDLIKRTMRRHRRRPDRLALRAGFQVGRVANRLRRPTGLTVVLAGPDGGGKSTLADGLEAASDGLFRRVSRLHVTPGLLPPPARLLGRKASDGSQPHFRAPSGRLGSLARIAYLATDTLGGWLPRAAIPRVRSGLVLIERGWRDLEVDPLRYRLSAGRSLVRSLARLLPVGDLTLILTASEEAIHERKPELGQQEIIRQLSSWKAIASEDPTRFAEVRTSSTCEALDSALTAMTQRLARRSGSLDRFAATLACFGTPRSDGSPHTVVSVGGSPRWILPANMRGKGPVGARLYRPSSIRARLGASALELRTRCGLSGGHTLIMDLSVGLRPELEALLGLSGLELAALLPTDESRSSRTVISAVSRGRVVALVKVTEQGFRELACEHRVLAALEACPTVACRTPSILGFFPWQGMDVLVTSPLELGGRTDRPLGSHEEEALIELAALRAQLEPALEGNGVTPVHGDFSGWNTSSVRGGGLAVWDWEWAHLGEPLEDWFHWQIQRLVHFRAGSMEALVSLALTPDAQLASLCSRVGLDPAHAPESLVAALQQGLTRTTADTSGVRVREQMLRMAGAS